MNLADFHFIRPFWLLAFIPVIISAVLIYRNKLQQGNWSSVCDPELLPFVLDHKALKQNLWPFILGCLSASVTIFALAGPTWNKLPTPVFKNEAALVIALDLTPSMDATDIKPSRLAMARYKITDILKLRKDGQTGLIVYSGDAFTVTPLTQDIDTITNQLNALQTEIMPIAGNNTGKAIKKATQLLTQSGYQRGEILLITDEVDLNSASKQIETESQINVSVLGIGTPQGAPIPLATGGFLKDKNGNIIIPKLKTQQLAQLANQGRGIYQSIQNNDKDVNALIQHLDKPSDAKKISDQKQLIEQWDEKGPWLFILLIPLVALNFRKGLLFITGILILPFSQQAEAIEWQSIWQTQNQQAQQQFNQNNYQQAADNFTHPQWKAAALYKAGQFEQAAEALQDDHSAAGLYNRANALAKSGQLEAAIKTYEQSLVQQPNNKDAQFNKEQVEKLLENQKNQSSQDNQSLQGDQQNSEQKNSEQQDGSQNNSEQQNSAQQSHDGSDSQQSQKQQDSSSEQNADQNQQASADQNQQSEKNHADSQASESTDQESNETTDQDSQAQSHPLSESEEAFDETEQANQQWLKRIPDDPAGLLKRKFKYQYRQRNRNDSQQSNTW